MVSVPVVLICLCFALLYQEVGGAVSNQVSTSNTFNARHVKRNKDQHRHCAKWAIEGQCTSNFKYMWTSCVNACVEYAKDTDELCDEWAEEGECTYNPGYVQLNCPKACKAGISWSPWLRREVGLPPLPPVNSGVAAGSGAVQLYPASGKLKPAPPADMLEAATQMHVRLKVYLHGGHQDLKGFSSAAPNEFLGMLGLTEACLYVLRMYQAIIEDLAPYGDSSSGPASPVTEEDGELALTFLERHQQHIDSILSAVKDSGFQSDMLSRNLVQWVGYADEAGEYISAQLEGSAEAEADSGTVSEAVATSANGDGTGGYMLGMYRMIGLYKGREVAVSLEPPVTDESREVQRLVEERRKAKEAAERRKNEERLRRLAELESEARAREQQWLQKERKLAQQREQEAEKARISELLRQAELAEQEAAVERVRAKQQVTAGKMDTGGTAAAAAAPPAATTTDAITATSSVTPGSVAKDALLGAASVGPARVSQTARSVTKVPLAPEPEETVAAVEETTSVAAKPAVLDTVHKPPRQRTPSVLHMHANIEGVAETAGRATHAAVNARVKAEPAAATVEQAPPEKVEAAVEAPVEPEAAAVPASSASSSSSAASAGDGRDVDATMRRLLMEGLATGGLALGAETGDTGEDFQAPEAEGPVGPGSVREGESEPEPVDHAQGLSEGTEVEDWVQEVLRNAPHGDIVQGSYEMHSGYDAFSDRGGFREPHIDGAEDREEGTEGGYSTEEVGHDPFRARTVEFDGMFAEEGTDEYVPRRRRAGGGRKSQASPTVVLSNGLVMPMIGFGTWQITGPDCVAAVKEAVAVGYRHIDTAQAYQNEREIGQAVSELVADGVVSRSELFIATKLSNEQFGGYLLTKQLIYDQMTALNVSYIDLYMLHSPFSEANLVLQYESWRALEDLYFEGRLLGIGVSNFDTKALKSLLNGARVAPMVVQNKFDIYHLGKQLDVEGDDIMSFTRSIGALMVAYSPFSAYPFVLSPLEDPIVKFISHRRTEEAESRGFQRRGAVTPAQVILRWILQQGVAVIPRTTSRDHMHENMHAGKVYPSLSADDMRLLSSIQHFVSTPLSIAIN